MVPAYVLEISMEKNIIAANCQNVAKKDCGEILLLYKVRVYLPTFVLGIRLFTQSGCFASFILVWR